MLFRSGQLSGKKHPPFLIASAQVKSAILLAGLYAKEKTSVKEFSKSRDHTERMLKYFGVNLDIEEEGEGCRVSIEGVSQLKAKDIIIPGDISSAAFFIVAASCLEGSEITIKNVGVNPTRTGIIDVMKRRMGADIKLKNKKTISEEPRADIIVKSSRLKGITIESSEIPRIIDEIPIIAVAAAKACGETVIKGVSELKVKESNRLMAIHNLFDYFRMKLDDYSSKKLVIPGDQIAKPKTFPGAACNSLGDHRIAMSGVIMGLMAEGETIVDDTDCINTSFPNFIEILKKMTPEGTIKVEK